MHEESTRSAAAHAAAGTAAEATGGREETQTAPQVPAAGCSCVYMCVCALQEPCTREEETCIVP